MGCISLSLSPIRLEPGVWERNPGIQQKFLADLGCDEIQGFHFCRPMPAEDVLPFLERHGR